MLFFCNYGLNKFDLEREANIETAVSLLLAYPVFHIESSRIGLVVTSLVLVDTSFD